MTNLSREVTFDGEFPTHLLLPLLHLLSFAFPALIFGADRGGDVARIRLDLLGVGLLEAEVVAPLKVVLPFQEVFPFRFGVVHLVLHHLVVRRDPAPAEEHPQEPPRHHEGLACS